MEPARRIFRIRGVVQGVGFRPFVYRTALRLGLRGAVWNDPEGVVVDAEGDAASLDVLAYEIKSSPPSRASIESMRTLDAVPAGAATFSIIPSATLGASHARVSADLPTCAAYLAEFLNPKDRRFRYPFINCTDCGPRYSIVEDVPYDRSQTTMRSFRMCPACASEYADPLSRRFHAQPNACPACGPRLWLHGSDREPIAATIEALREGKIVALKGIGGFHLACDARSESAVRKLRERKHRSGKPFAVMFPDLPSLERELVPESLHPTAPIALLKKKAGSTLASGIAPGLDEVGAFLPYTPLHHLVVRQPLVMTSGNRSDEPIAIRNDEALERLGDIADLFILHDRDIHMRMDDSVMRGGKVLRRARGFVPESINLGFDSPPILAVGADLKNTLCLTAGGAAILSQHIGDLESWEAQQFFAEARRNLERLFRVTPQYVAHDLHPGYHSTRMARATGLPAIAVQHHHAHIASCLAENGRRDRVIGVAWDGTGYGADGTIWGGEFLIADLAGFERKGRLRPVPLPGGDSAVRAPWRMALSHLLAAELPATRVVHTERASVEAMIRSGFGGVPTSSAGRLFDAVASLAGVCHFATYEGQAAMELEAICEGDAPPYPMPVIDGDLLELDPRPLLRALLDDLDRGVPAPLITSRFHAALALGIGELCERLRSSTQLSVVALSGGCFQNRRLSRSTKEALVQRGFEVLVHFRVPAGDGGIALGQAAMAAWRLRDVSGHSR